MRVVGVSSGMAIYLGSPDSNCHHLLSYSCLSQLPENSCNIASIGNI